MTNEVTWFFDDAGEVEGMLRGDIIRKSSTS